MFKSINRTIELICLPECVAIFSDSKKKLNCYFDQWHIKFIEFVKRNAKKNNTSILIGSIPYRKKNLKFFNRSILIDSSGREIEYYDKINLFDVELSNKEKYYESNNFDAGKKVKVADSRFGKLGLSICYDLRFPNLYRKLAKKGAHFISVPAAFTHTTGKAHWEPLLRSRAIENGCFILAPAQVGNHENGRKTYGNSMIVDPWGKILSKASNSPGIIYAKIDKSLIEECRGKIPSMTSFSKNS